MNGIRKARVKKTNEIVNVRMKQVKTGDAEYIMFEDIDSKNMYNFTELNFNVSADMFDNTDLD